MLTVMSITPPAGLPRGPEAPDAPATVTVTVSSKGATRARAGHPWIFRSDVASAPPGLDAGAEVRLCDARGNFVARAFWAAKSPIALRVLSRRDEPLDEELLRGRVRAAFERRQIGRAHV